MTQGNIGAWNKKVGDSIAPGEVLVEIETDKAQMDFEFQEEGYIAKILTDENAKEVSVGQVCNNDTECKRVFIGVLVAHTFIFLAYCCFS
jgi:pyruvate/2-oxoglutarate dehydrogenase complex dihydrolipoamide acyltransferase (E2) component